MKSALDTPSLPRAFIMRRLHSLWGLWLVLYLAEHLFVNAQAALYFRDNGRSFISLVNKIQDLPFLKAIELLFLALPFLGHGIWGIIYALQGKQNSWPTDKTRPELTHYSRNHAYSWQRITSWILLIGIVIHVIDMRFVRYPSHIAVGLEERYLLPVVWDPGLAEVAAQQEVSIYNASMLRERIEQVTTGFKDISQDQERAWLQAATKRPLKANEVLIEAKSAGPIFFINLRETFKNPWMVGFYSLLVIAATFHAFNGLWTFTIAWGIALTVRAQRRLRTLCDLLMGLVTLFGLMAVWGFYLSFWVGR